VIVERIYPVEKPRDVVIEVNIKKFLIKKINFIFYSFYVLKMLFKEMVAL
jgi:hypothetical protein